MTAVTLEHRYEPRGTAARLFECRDAEVLMAGPAGTGKSRACLEKLHMLALVNPGMRGLIVRKTLASLGSTALVTWEKAVVPESLRAGDVTFYGGGPKEPASYRYTNGSTIVIGGMDKSIRIMSSEYDVVYAQEATELTENDWESITTRLRNGKISFQQLIADCNPDAPTHWLKVRCDNKKTTMLESRHEENPVYFDDDGQVTPQGAAYMAKLDALTGVRLHRLRTGLWVAAEGVIYDDFDPAIHLVDLADIIPGGRALEAKGRKLTAANIPEEWPRFWAVDFGFVNPFVLQCWAENPDGQLILYREIYRTKQTVDEHAKRIMELVSKPDPDYTRRDGDPAHRGRIWTEPKPRALVCDHDAEGRAQLAKHLNMPTKAADKKVKEGIETVQIRLRKRSDGTPGMLIVRDARIDRDQDLADAKKPTCTAEEMPVYVWDIRDGIKSKDEPVKENDHGCDAKRYMSVYRDPRSRPGMRTL